MTCYESTGTLNPTDSLTLSAKMSKFQNILKWWGFMDPMLRQYQFTYEAMRWQRRDYTKSQLVYKNR